MAGDFAVASQAAQLAEEEEALERAWQRYASRAAGHVYFIQSGPEGAIKIGYTADDVETRRATLQAGNPELLYLRALIPGDVGLERRLHVRFAAGRGTGEWFAADTPGLGDLITDALHMESFPDDRDSEQAKVLAAC